MILRRFMKHVTDQNWFAVGLDVMVVIVGIFLGLQVQEYYEKIADRELEQNYLAKLHTDTDKLIALAENFTKSTQQVSDNLKSLSLMLLADEEGATINKGQCNSLAFSHIYVTRIVSLPTLDELLSSGQILLITNEEIRSLISEFTIRTQRTIMLLNSLQADKLDFPREYSKIIKLKSSQAGNLLFFNTLITQCDYQLMRESDEFKNRLIGNNARFNAYVGEILSQLDALQQLHNALEHELEISHEETLL